MIGIESESSFEGKVMRLARLYGVCGYHPHTSEGARGIHTLRRDDHRCGWGWPDWVFVKAERWVKFRELKAENGRLTRDQRFWQDLLALAGADVGVWRPSMLEQIARELAA
ncbi:MAG TPA: VRR-NUC domain-containing protein [Chloroflexota bacterium]|nr:VRR-NUC domain-containing protein [Chloroflexota bacterium]